MEPMSNPDARRIIEDCEATLLVAAGALSQSDSFLVGVQDFKRSRAKRYRLEQAAVLAEAVSDSLRDIVRLFDRGDVDDLIGDDLLGGGANA